MNVNENTVCGEWQDGPHGRWRFCAPRAMLGLPSPPKARRQPHPETTPFRLTEAQEEKARRLITSALEGE